MIYQQAIRKEKTELLKIIKNKSCVCRNENIDKIKLYTNNLIHIENPIRKDNISTAKKILRHVCPDCPTRESFKDNLMKWLNTNYVSGYEKYSAFLYNETDHAALNVSGIAPVILR